MWARVGDNKCAIDRRLNKRSSMVCMDGSCKVCDLHGCSECSVASKLFGPELQVALFKLAFLRCGKLALQVEHGSIERSSYFFMLADVYRGVRCSVDIAIVGKSIWHNVGDMEVIAKFWCVSEF